MPVREIDNEINFQWRTYFLSADNVVIFDHADIHV